MQIFPLITLAGIAAAARPDNSKTFIFSYPHHTYTKTLYGEKAEHLTTTHMTIARPHHTHTKTFFTWIGNGAAPTDVEDIPDDEEQQPEEPEESSAKPTVQPSSKVATSAQATSSEMPSIASKGPEANETAPQVSSIFEGGAAAAGVGAGGLAVALLLL
ncbi:uncharacterized protein CXQ87_004690 [Candidozyma duobushaemuli]|uniref:Uncharacterized protein n=2 Tax=Candidozyma TaxID=3303203 RepID=A0ABX8IA79_9ASCO|nr:uncharacterized protein CXQ87_004690 [[Candida] duobushaemulonis]PVH16399.1 hypothetical protein CXQ87_004690 [[Candida] duobushaemulonis]QWU90171.1 hypothetical protein CA3LBN_004532 [[Candida] haemuloni]